MSVVRCDCCGVTARTHDDGLAPVDWLWFRGAWHDGGHLTALEEDAAFCSQACMGEFFATPKRQYEEAVA